MCFAHAGARVDHLDLEKSSRWFGQVLRVSPRPHHGGAHGHGSPVGAGFHRIADQIEEDLVQTVSISLHLRQGGIVISDEIHAVGGISFEPDHRIQQFMKIESGNNELRRFTVTQKFSHEPFQPLQFSQNHHGIFTQFGSLASLACQQLGGAFDAAQGILQLVGQAAQHEPDGIHRPRFPVGIFQMFVLGLIPEGEQGPLHGLMGPLHRVYLHAQDQRRHAGPLIEAI